MKAKIKVKQGDLLIREYEIEYKDAMELASLYQEERKVWDEYHVTAETPAYDISHSHTYKQQLQTK